MSPEKYRNSPIVEAICEFNLVKSQPWDWTIPGILYTKISDQFPVKREIKGLGVEVSLKANSNPSMIKYSDSVERLQFWSKNKEQVVQIGENKLIINKRKPYRGWGEFSNLISSITAEYNKITEHSAIDSFNLRYINNIENLPSHIDLEQYFLIYPRFPVNLTEATGPLYMQSTFHIQLHKKINSNITVSFFNQNQNNQTNWLIDINLIGVFKEPANLDITEILTLAHGKISETFEACITDELRKLFRRE